MINVAILDDELHCIESLVLYIQDLFPEMKIVYKSARVQEAVERLRELEIDLLFLDIEMPGMNGFQLLEHLPDRHFDVIFTTAYSQYALQAFKAKAVSYLLKPLDEDELKEAIADWKESQKSNSPADNTQQLLEHLKKEGFLKSKISVPVAGGYEFLDINEIIYCKSQSNYTIIYLDGREEIIVSKTMKKIEKAMEPFFFIRVHQSYLINPYFMKKFYKNKGGYLEMQDKTEIPVSQTKRKLVLNLFDAIAKKQP